MGLSRNLFFQDEKLIRKYASSQAESEELLSILSAAKRGSLADMYKLALRSKKNEDFNTASKWLKKLISKDSDYVNEAWNGLGTIASLRNDIDEAERCFKVAAEAGLPVALFNYGIILEENLNDLDTAMDFYFKARDAGFEKAKNRIQFLQQRILQNRKEDYSKGLEYERKREFEKAKYWYLQATSSEGIYEAKAWNGLGNIAWKQERNSKSAMDYYSRAINLGLPVASYNYAQVLVASSNDLNTAISYFRHALDGGYIKAKSRIIAIETTITKRDRERQSALADRKYSEGLKAESEHRYSDAKVAFQESARLGHAQAQISLQKLSQRPRPRQSMSPLDAEAVMAEWLRWWNIKDARPGKGRKDKGIDIESEFVVGQVKHQSQAATREHLQKLHSNMAEFGRIGIFFSRSGYTKTAREFANQRNIRIAIFEFNWHGEPKPLNQYAHDVVNKIHPFQR